MDRHYLNTIEALPHLHNRIIRVQIEKQSFETILDRYDRDTTFFYLDPTYLRSTRKPGNVYRFEVSEDEHVKMLTMLNGLDGKVLLSGYDSELYNDFLNGWSSYRKEVPGFTFGSTKPTSKGFGGSKVKDRRVEMLWWNY